MPNTEHVTREVFEWLRSFDANYTELPADDLDEFRRAVTELYDADNGFTPETGELMDTDFAKLRAMVLADRR
jgi:hypothetical protein